MRQPRDVPRYHLCLYTHSTQSAPSYVSVSVLRQGGILEDWVTKGGERKHVFFYQAEDGHYIPRAALIDLEPREGGGAGNGWAQGYAAGERIYDEVMDMLHRFMLMHSIADGTGSGLGSYVLNGSTIVPKEADAAYSVFQNHQ
ncbi:Tubulin/FtsZ, GTPase domain-containing protein [Gautieria morchelliformis]|nr:Tubulin/FtsZ, GTPase domain-containing protein [Gautieria morchelliformis]